jgi:hypothetical protein
MPPKAFRLFSILVTRYEQLNMQFSIHIPYIYCTSRRRCSVRLKKEEVLTPEVMRLKKAEVQTPEVMRLKKAEVQTPEVMRVKREEAQPAEVVYENRIAWLCGDPSK